MFAFQGSFQLTCTLSREHHDSKTGVNNNYEDIETFVHKIEMISMEREHEERNTVLPR
jgi:hypothetical protein